MLLTIMLCGIFLSLLAQEKKVPTVPVFGYVADSFTKTPASGTTVYLMTADSVVTDSMNTFDMNEGSLYCFHLQRKRARYFLKFVNKAYEEKIVPFTLKPGRNRQVDLPLVFIKRKQTLRQRTLGEATVTATKIKMFHRGDTVVYNADAFNVADGSMLDELIKQMPGVELKRTGEIFVNGKKIDYMLLNGKDFYRGNNKIMLENLPYYMVQDIKVYNKTTLRSIYTGEENAKKDFVMDVNMKRQYREGYIANAEVGVGTEDAYLARLFGLRFTDHSRLSLIGNLNNLNTATTPAADGTWADGNDMPRNGRITSKHLQAGLNIDNPKWKNDLQAHEGWRKDESLVR